MNEGRNAGRLKELWNRARLFSLFLYRQFIDDRCLITATALSYTTLLSLVPLLVVLFTTLSAFPAFDQIVERMQAYIFRNFVPAASETIQAYFSQFLQRAGALTGVGGAFLVVGALMLMNTIDDAINAIWRVRKRRRLVLKISVYWAALTLGPLLLAVSIAGTSYLIALPEDGEPAQFLLRLLLSLLPFLFTTLGLTLLYVFVPNCNVPIRNGLLAAVIAAIAFEIAKAGFAAFVAGGTAYATIYGALAAIPLFLTWIYVSWAIALIGAELSYGLTTFKAGRFQPTGQPRAAELLTAFRLVGHLWEGQLRGRPVSSAELLERERLLSTEGLSSLMDRLQSNHVVYSVDSDEWVLARDLGSFTLLDLYRLFPLPIEAESDPGNWGTDDWSRALSAKIVEARNKISEGLRVLEVPLRELYGQQ